MVCVFFCGEKQGQVEGRIGRCWGRAKKTKGKGAGLESGMLFVSRDRAVIISYDNSNNLMSSRQKDFQAVLACYRGSYRAV